MLDDALAIVDAFVAEPDSPDLVVRRLAELDVARVAIDAPDACSVGAHVDDDSLGAKFRSARCGEIALGRTRRIWVSWPTPRSEPFPAWMTTGFALFAIARAAGMVGIEVYPHAVFRVLAGRRPPTKTSAAGIAARVALLRDAGITNAPFLPMWSHDGLDAAAAALVAADPQAEPISCGHDGSAIWLPSPR